MSNDLIQFNFENDLEQLENQFPCSNIESIYINDNNNGNYSNGKVNFTSASIVGSVADKQSFWSEAKIIMPYTVTLEAIACKFAISDSTATQENSLAVGTKGYHNFVDNFTGKFNGVPLNSNTNYVNLLMNEKIKTMGNEEKLLIGDLLNFEFDNENSLNYVSTLGETNNIIKNPILDVYKSGLNDKIFTNQAHFKRMSNTNYNPLSTNSNYNKIFDATTLGNSLSPFMEINTTSKLTFRGVAVIPLYLFDCFKSLPSVNTTSNFELNLQMNIGLSNSYTVTYTGVAAGGSQSDGVIHSIKSIASVQSVGNTCPFLISQAGVNAGTGLSIRSDAATATDFSVKLTSQIGWGQGTQPIRIYLPTAQMNPNYTKMILNQPKYKLLYNNYYQDAILNIAGGSTASKAFNVNINRPRMLYILPFLSNQNALTSGFMTSPFLSPVSSAPNTVSPCSLTNLQIQIGGQNIFSEPLQYNYQYYNDNVMSLIGKYNGNSIKSNQFSGQITKSQWEKAYGVYMINLQKVSDQTQDDLAKSFQISFRVNTKDTVKYDFIILLEYQTTKYINRVSGLLTDN